MSVQPVFYIYQLLHPQTWATVPRKVMDWLLEVAKAQNNSVGGVCGKIVIDAYKAAHPQEKKG